MKKSTNLLFIVCFISLFIFQTVTAEDIGKPFVEGQIWNGWYDCGEGKTKLKFTISKVNNRSRTNQRISAIYDFTTLKGVNGAFNTMGRYRSRSKIAVFKAVSWIKKPTGYGSPGVRGTVSADGMEFSGQILWQGCSDFILYSPDYENLTKADNNEEKMAKAKQLPDKIKTLPQKQKVLQSATNNIDKSSYKFEQNRPPSNGSYSINMHFNSIKDVAIISKSLDEIVKADLLKRAKNSRSTYRIEGQYNFFVNGKELEWRRYKFRTNKGWEPVIGVALDVTQKSRIPNQKPIPKERFKYSIIDQASSLFNSPEKLEILLKLGFFVEGEIPSSYKFVETSKQPTGSEKWYNKKKVIMKGVSLSVEVTVDDFSTLINDREKLVHYAKLDLQNRIAGEQYDSISAFYWFKSDPKNKRLVSISINKRAGGGFHVHRPLAILEILATGSEEDFTKRYRMSKAMFIALQNGNKKQLKELKNEQVAKVESNTNKNNLEIQIANSLNEIQRLPVLYITESRKWNLVDGISPQEVARKAVDKYGFPMNSPLTDEQITLKKRELAELISNLGNKANKIGKSAPRAKVGYSSYIKIPLEQQKKLSEQVLYPAIMDIQTKTIELLSKIPRTEEGLLEAYELDSWLSSVETDYRIYWNKLLELKSQSGGGVLYPHEVCQKLSSSDQIALGPKTGRCFFEVIYSSRLIRNVWRIQYMRDIDAVISKKIKDNGADLYRRAFLFAYDLRGEEFDNFAESNFSNFGVYPDKSNERCLFDNCSSQLTKHLISEFTGKPLSNERKKQYVEILENKSKGLFARWNESVGQSNFERHSIQSDIVNYSRDVAKYILLKLSKSAAKRLEEIQTKDHQAYKNWNQKTAKPIRQQVVAWRKLWDIGFGIGKEEDAVSALGLSSVTSSYLNARHSGGSPFMNIAEILYNAQYEWIVKSEKGTTADATVKFPQGWSSSGSYQKPKPRTRHYAQLMTPTDLFFESIGNQIGEAGSAIASYGSLIAELQQRIIKSRKAYFKCLPDCSDIRVKEALYSKSLIEKDIYFMQLSGRTGSIVDKGHQSMTTIIEGLSGTNGFILVDGGIPKVCHGYFDRWVSKFGKAHGQDGRAEIDAIFSAYTNLVKGDFSGLQEEGFKMVQKQQEAFSKSATEYRKYQVCRDQYEFDRYAK